MTETLPPTTLSALREAEAACTRCPLYRDATQVVPGEGPARARLMMVGEQPRDQEDLQGRPFVGPAGPCSTGRSPQPASIAARCSSPMR